MSLNFNLNPYYDDFDESKGFHRILFKPGYAVQARELTQIQTQLHNQISQFGDHIFKDGSIVLGGNSFLSSVNYVDVATLTLSSDTDLSSKTIEGQTTGATGKIVSITQPTSTTTRIYFNYTNGILFEAEEIVAIEGGFSSTIVAGEAFYGFASSYSVDQSVFYVSGNFVYCEPQTIIISDSLVSNNFVGLLVNEEVVTSVQDTSLLDPALGSYNYSAPGADRYSISLDLYAYTFNPEDESGQQVNDTNFIELSRIVNGQQVTLNNLPVYSEIENTFARRTYDESGDYTVKAFNIKIQDHIYGNTDTLSVQIDPGKCYIKGYEFATIAPTYLDIPKARDTVIENGFPTYVDYGNYIVIKGLKGDIDYTGNRNVNLYNSTTISGGTLIGNCTIKLIDFDSYDGANNIYNLYLDNVRVSSTSSISNLRAFANTTVGFQANVSTSSYTSNVTIQNNGSSTYILKIPKENIKTLLIDSQSDTSYTTQKRFTPVSFVANASFANATVTNPISNQYFIGSGGLSASEIRENFLVTVTSNGGGGPVAGTVLTYETGLRVTIVDENNIQISYTGSYNFTASVVATVATSAAEQKIKLLQSDGVLNVASASINTTMSLLKSDCYKLDSVIAVSNTAVEYEYTNNYELFTGQTDILYDHGYVRLKQGHLNPVQDGIDNISYVLFNFSYFTHTGSGFCSVDSYTNSGVDYEDIPVYSASNGDVYDLKNCLDFRPRRDDGSANITGGLLANPSTIIYCDFENYKSRIDKLVVTKERKFHLIQGISDIDPAVPTDISDAMNLYTINVPAYTAKAEDVSFNFVENKRYTMRDIGKIEKRVEKLEYYTSLSLLEKQASDESIPSDIPTIDRFKNGILVDSFAGHSVGNIYSEDYKCSVDYNNRILRPPFSSTSHTYLFSSGTNYYKGGDLITLNYTSEIFATQGSVTGWVNVNPYNVYMWTGYVNLNPASDNWIDTYRRPDVTVNMNGENDIYTVLAGSVSNPAASGVRWSDWQTIVNGIPQVSTTSSSSTSTAASGSKVLQTTTTSSTQTSTVNNELARVGLDIKTGAVQTVTRDLGSKVVDTSIVPYIRSRVVDFVATGLKPRTKMYATFDGVNITSYCYPTTELTFSSNVNPDAKSCIVVGNTDVSAKYILVSGRKVYARVENSNSSIGITKPRRIVTGNTVTVYGETSSFGNQTVTAVKDNIELITDEFGTIAGSFLIPNNDKIQFRTGERIFKLVDDVGTSPTTAAAVKYVASGLSQSTERTIVATRISTMSIDPVLDTDTITTKTSAVSKTSSVVDVTPPVPAPAPAPKPVPALPAATNSCGTTVNGGNTGRHSYTINFGSGVGSCGVNYNAMSVPDRYTIIWNGLSYSTGFVGSTSYNGKLAALGFPGVSGPGSGQLRFNKTLESPSTATMIVDAPLSGTAWRYTVVCPEVNSTAAPLPVIVPAPTFTLNLSSPTSFNVTDLALGRLHDTSVGVEINSSRKFNASVTLSIVTSSGATYSLSNASLVVAGKSSTLSRFIIADNTYKGSSVKIQANAVEVNAQGVPTGLTSFDEITITHRYSPPPVRVDPVAQTFFVDVNKYPNGIFLDSLDIFFRSKSAYLPVMVEIRPTVNGYPSSNDILPFSDVSKAADQVTTSTDGSLATNFKFTAPVYLAAGEYAFVVKCNTDEYTIYTARIGDYSLVNPTTRITEQPSIGSMFKSQNSSTWTPIQEEDIKFVLKKCVFSTTTAADVTLKSKFTSTGDEEYDLFFTDGETLNFASTRINYSFKTTNLNNVLDSTFTPYQLGSNANLPERMKIRYNQGTDLQFKVGMTTTDRNITPAIDLSRLSSVLVKNTINNCGLDSEDFKIVDYGTGYSSNGTVTINGTCTTPATAFAEYKANTGRISIVVTNPGAGYTGNVTATVAGGGASVAAVLQVANEQAPTGGNAVARYMTRKVTLAPSFESTDLKAFLLANVPSGTSIELYYKVAPLSSIDFDAEEWYMMTLESSGTPSETGFVEYKYKTPGDTALISGDRFKTFALKIVMLSSNYARVPQIRDLRVIALDE